MASTKSLTLRKIQLRQQLGWARHLTEQMLGIIANLVRRTAVLVIVLICCIFTFAATGVRQVAVVDIPGKPGFDDAVFANGMIVIAHTTDNTADIFDPVKRRVIGHVKDLAAPRGVTTNEDASRVFLANSGANSVVVIETEKWQVQRSVPVQGSPEALLPIPKSQLLFATLPEKQQIALVDLAHGTQVSTVDVGGRPEAMAYDSSRNLVYVTLQDRKEVLAINPQMQIVCRFALNGSLPTGIVYDAKGDRIYVAVRFAVLSLDGQTGAEVSRAPVSGGIDQLWLDTENHTLFGAANGSFFVMKAESKLGEPEEIALNVKGHTFAYDPSKKLLYVPGGSEGRAKLLILKQLSTGLPLQQEQNARAVR